MSERADLTRHVQLMRDLVADIEAALDAKDTSQVDALLERCLDLTEQFEAAKLRWAS